ncbi:hypothetical protein ACM75Y_28965 [Pseudomonas aeruginosa]
MNKANECTCPSGDGSLVHPCPAHPAVEQVGGDERAAFEAAFAAMGRPVCRADYDQDAYGTPFDDGGWTGWQARAALAQPSPVLPPFAEKVLAKLRRFYDCASDFESGGVDIGRRWLDLLTQLGLLNRIQRSPALWEISQQGEDLLGAPQHFPAQAEAERPEVVARVVHSNPVVLGQCGPLNANDELMTVAQHAASVARWAEMFNRVEQQRDAALARVAELTATRNRYGLDAHYFNKNLQRILRDFESFTPDELARSLIILAKVADEKVVAQAQHSVPEGWMLVECGIWTQEQVDEMQKTVARFRNSEFVDDRALAMAVADAGQCKAPEISLAELLAAATGKEGL